MSEYSIWVLEYSFLAEFPVSGQIYGAHNQGARKCPYCYVLLKGHGLTAMIDVGYNHKDYGRAMAERFGVSNWHPPKTVLAECGVDPGDVSHVILTHAHFDHMGNTDDFPNATFYIQERELSKWVWAMSLNRRHRWLMMATDPGDIMRAVDLARQGRLVCLDGAREDLLPGIDVHPAFDSHTWGSMFVDVRNDGQRASKDRWIFAGDLVYCFENLVGNDLSDPQYIPVGLATGSQTELLMVTDRMVELADGETRRVIPIHENGLWRHFPSRMSKNGLRIVEIALADGEVSGVRS
jgi:glyoxylase-like metal-dependent hydrolase (beta-lactamase superfamily II)